ncbi:hypothetical protein Tco_0210131 [Tanacetum coccineum]
MAPADRLKIGKCNLHLSSDVTSKEATLQVVYDVLKLTPFYKAFQNHLLRSLGHSGDIRKITDVNVNKLHQPWRSFAAIINKCLGGKPSYDNIRLSQAQILWVALTNEDIRNSESYKEYYVIASGTIPPKTKRSKKKANTGTITKQKPPTAPKDVKEKKSGQEKQKAKHLETISEEMMTEAEQLKIITKRSHKETHSSHASGSGADEGTGVTPGVPDAPEYNSEDDISWKSSDDDQDDEKVQDADSEAKNVDDETTQADEDDDVHDDDENTQDDDDEEQTKSDDDGDDFVHPTLTIHDEEIIHEEETDEDDSFNPTIHTPSHISSSDDEGSDNEIEMTNVAWSPQAG